MIKIIIKIILIWGTIFCLLPVLNKYLSINFFLPICFILSIIGISLTLNILTKEF